MIARVALLLLLAPVGGCLYRTCSDSAGATPLEFVLPLDAYERVLGDDGELSNDECVAICRAFASAYASVESCEAGPIVYPGGGSDTASFGLDATVTISCVGSFYCR